MYIVAPPQRDGHPRGCTREANAPDLFGRGREMKMNPLFRRLTCLLMLTGVLVPLTVLATPAPVHADTCTPIATLPADLTPSGPLDTGANVIATFNNARQQEGCNVSLSIDPAAYDAASWE